MLITIDDSVINYIKDKKNKEESYEVEIDALNAIAQACRQGNHIVIASVEVLEYLQRLNELDNSSIRVYDRLLRKFVYAESYKKLARDRIVIKNRDAVFKSDKIGNNTIFEVPINYFTKSTVLEHTVLLSEDLSDCHFYEKLALKYVKEKLKHNELEIKFQRINGGGLNTYKSFEDRIERGNIVLAIIDSDKSYPNDKIGNTLKEVNKVFEQYKSYKITKAYSLDVMEKENLVSPSMYSLCGDSSSKRELENMLKIESNTTIQECLKYIDYKNGVKIKNDTDEKYIEYYKEIFGHKEEICVSDEEITLLNPTGIKIDKFQHLVLEDNLEKQLEKKKFLKHIPSTVIEDLEDRVNKKNELFEIIPEYLKPQIEDLCTQVISWGISGKIMST